MGKKKSMELSEVFEILDSQHEVSKKKKDKKSKKSEGIGIPASKSDFHEHGKDKDRDEFDKKHNDDARTKSFEEQKMELALKGVEEEIRKTHPWVLPGVKAGLQEERIKLRDQVKSCTDMDELNELRSKMAENEYRMKIVLETIAEQQEKFEKETEAREKLRKDRVRKDAKDELESLKERYGSELIKELCA